MRRLHCRYDSTLLWLYAANSDIEAAPAVYAGIVYAGSNDGVLHAVRDNVLLWQYMVGNEIQTPSISANGTIYVSSNDECIHGLHGSTGALIWEVCHDNYAFSTVSLANDGAMYATVIDTTGALCAVMAFGPAVWTYTASCALLPWVRVLPQPTVGLDGAIYVGFTDGRHHAVRNGVLLHTYGILNDAESVSLTVLSTDGAALFVLVQSGAGVLYAVK